MDPPWSNRFALSDGESDSDREDATTPQPQQMGGVPFTEQSRVQELSADTRLARELDLSTRQDTAIFRKTPWTVAKINAALRPPVKSSRLSGPDTHHVNFSNASFVTTGSPRPLKEVSQSKTLTNHFREGSGRNQVPAVEPPKERLDVQDYATTGLGSSRKKEVVFQDICSLSPKKSQSTWRRPFLSTPMPLQQPISPVPVPPKPRNQLAQAKVEGMHFPSF